MTAAQTTIQRFALSLLAYKGALVEEGDRSAGVLLGTETASALGMNEYERLVFDPSAETAGALRMDYDAPCFEALGRLTDAMGRFAFVSILAPELRNIDPEKELERTLRLQNGVFRFRDCVQVTQPYFCFFLQYDVLADERSGGVEEVWVNPATNSMPRMVSLLETEEIRDAAPPAALAALSQDAWRLASANAAPSILSRLAGFLGSLERRRERDLERMRDYYQTVDEEIRRKIARMTSKEDVRQAEIERLAATARAYQARAAELVERYRVQIRVIPIGVLVCEIPAYQIRVQLLRRSARAEMSFSWNPFDRKIEARCCDACRQVTGTTVLCDDRVHYLCFACLAACPACSKAYCHACHKRCPRIHVN
jgi:hypothetical protein